MFLHQITKQSARMIFRDWLVYEKACRLLRKNRNESKGHADSGREEEERNLFRDEKHFSLFSSQQKNFPPLLKRVYQQKIASPFPIAIRPLGDDGKCVSLSSTRRDKPLGSPRASHFLT